ncbi:MAG TPA: hypothetical protein DHV00_08240 [Alteromonas macleodii]|mgnify:CR=1 FL=1|nr:hypothetical protein [Alteromonas macleodii]|tara:strand:- start:386 stop:922 length:537 start_codon:yes stop_codon:yes gene_type:complete
MDAFYLGLEEVDEAPDKSVGEVFKLEDSVYLMVPFIHCGHHFLTYFSPVQGTPELPFDIFKSAVEANSDHIVSDSPYILKFGLREHANSDRMFSPIDGSIKSIHFTLPAKLVICVRKLIEKTGTNEFYFLAGGDDDKRIERLDRWYRRITNSLAPKEGFEAIHSETDYGGWYGYKTSY